MAKIKRSDLRTEVAIIVPFYNDEKYIDNCLKSIKNQTAGYWEAWLIDDCSEDSSLSVAEKYCADDCRFHLIRNESNSSTWVCRAKGIIAASETVKYIMFCDADDTMLPKAVERVYKAMEKAPADILHFGANVVDKGGHSKRVIERYKRYISPNRRSLKGREVFNNFAERSFEGHLWNKAFNAVLLKGIIARTGVEHFLPKAQDKVLYWAAACGENVTYRSVKWKIYNYNYGNGIEGNLKPTVAELRRYFFSQAYAENLICDITRTYVSDITAFQPMLDASRYNLIRHTVRTMLRLPMSDRKDALNLIKKYWNKEFDGAEIICALAETAWDKQPEISDMLLGVKIVECSEKSEGIKVIGTYYHRMDNGGIQRVIARLIPVWHKMGYEIVLFTDSKPSENDYDLPEYVVRVVVDRDFASCRAENYRERGMSLARLLKKYKVDCMVYHSYFSDVLLFDACVCKAMNVPFVLYQHNVFSRYLRYNDNRFSTIPIYARHANAVVCLDEISGHWWKNFNNNTFTVMNPLTFEPDKIKSSARDNHNILFVGRLVEESKRPSHAVDIAAKVIKRYPDAKLFIVGSSDDRRYIGSLEKKIRELCMTDNIVLCGFQKNVEQYYERCGVFLSCSSHEGFMLTICEAMSYGLPVIMYELPYLAAVKNNQGVISVPQNDKDAAADAICGLFSDHKLLINTGNAGRAYIEAMSKTDIAGQWKKVLASLYSDSMAQKNLDSVMAQIIINDYMAGSVDKSEAVLPMSFKIKRYYAQFGLWRTFFRVFEKLTEKLKKGLV